MPCLQVSGISAEYYHASLEKTDRLNIYDKWKREKLQVIVACCAFRMGKLYMIFKFY